MKPVTIPPIVWIGLAAAIGFTAYQFGRQRAQTPAPAPTQTTSGGFALPNWGGLLAARDPRAETLLSQGERLMITESTSPAKLAGIAALAQGDFATAVAQFQVARGELRNDPETLIYLNNARLGPGPAADIAVVVPISSSVNPAREILRGVAHMQDLHNLNRGNALPLRVWIGDDNNDPTQAQTIAHAIVRDPRFLAVVGHGTSATSVAVAPIYRQGQKVMIAPTSTSTELVQVNLGTQNFIFRTVPSDQFTGTALARYLLSQNRRRVSVFFNAQSSYSRSLRDAFATTLTLEGGEILQVVDLSQGELPPIDNASQGVVLLSDAATFDRAIQVARLNNGRLPLFGGDALYRIDTLQQGQAAVNGMILPVPWHPQRSGDPQFPAAARQVWGGDVNWRTALAYDATLAITTALRSGLTDPTALARALASPDFQVSGVTGQVRFTPSGERQGNVLLVQIQPGTLSKTGFDFVPLN
ncbi:MAG: ABC transporter substrate-binding protein [Thermostichales cyanobacterium SRBZ-1_bins_19]